MCAWIQLPAHGGWGVPVIYARGIPSLYSWIAALTSRSDGNLREATMSFLTVCSSSMSIDGALLAVLVIAYGSERVWLQVAKAKDGQDTTGTDMVG